MKILIIDPDRDLVEMLTSWLKTLGYEVSRAYTGERASLEWERQQPDLVVIDPLLRDRNGLELCRELRTSHDAMVLVMTESNDVHDEIHCLESGADDYLRKPFFPRQFLARLHAVQRRGRPTLPQRPSSRVTVGALRVDSLRHEVVVEGKTVRLTPKESKLLHLLAVNAGNVCPVEQIVAHLWGLGADGGSHLIKAHVRHVRQKIEQDASHPVHLRTVPGVGYMLTRDLQPPESSRA